MFFGGKVTYSTMPLITVPSIWNKEMTFTVQGESVLKGRIVVDIHLEVVFNDKEVWEHFRNPANLGTLYNHCNDKIRERFGNEWLVLRDLFRPNLGTEFVKEEVTKNTDIQISKGNGLLKVQATEGNGPWKDFFF